MPIIINCPTEIPTVRMANQSLAKRFDRHLLCMATKVHILMTI